MCPPRGKKQQAKPQNNEDDDFEFLMAAAAKNQERKEEEKKAHEIPDSVFKDLPEPPCKTYPDRQFPVRDIQEYNEHVGFRPRDKEQAVALEELEASLPDLREGGIVHEQVRDWAMNAEIIKPGVKLYDMCANIEEAVRRQVQFEPPVRGLAFPCGCSINNCAAHYSPLPGDNRTLGQSDVMKIDFGVAINGMVIDSAWTVCFDDTFKPLIDASKEATNKAIRMSGPDARISEIGAEIEEVIRSYQLDIAGKIYEIQPVANLTGHQMARYQIHAGKFIPMIKERPGMERCTDKMEVGELYALETFATTGNGLVLDDGAVSHFMLSPEYRPVKRGSQQELVDCIKKNFKTLAFCQRFLEKTGQTNYNTVLTQLIKSKVINPYPPLSDQKGSWVSQHEHCFAILPKGKEVLSRTHE